MPTCTHFRSPESDCKNPEIGIDAVRNLAATDQALVRELAASSALRPIEAEHLAWICLADLEEDRVRSATAVQILNHLAQRFTLPERLIDRIYLFARHRCSNDPWFQAAVQMQIRLVDLYYAHSSIQDGCCAPTQCRAYIVERLSAEQVRSLTMSTGDPQFLRHPAANLALARQMADAHADKIKVVNAILERAEWAADFLIRSALCRKANPSSLARLFSFAEPGAEARSLFRMVCENRPEQAVRLLEKDAGAWQRAGLGPVDLLPLFSSHDPGVRRRVLLSLGALRSERAA